jgi:uncharacterized protein
MSFEIQKTFVVKAPAPAVWEFLSDPRRVARCMPGAAVTEQIDDKTYAGTMTVKVGPVQATYKGQLRFEQLDPATRSAQIAAAGQEVRGKGGANMRLTSRVSERAPGETEVAASSEVNVTGVLAQFGRGMIQDVSDQLFRKFTEAVRAELEPLPATANPTAVAASSIQGDHTAAPASPAASPALSAGPTAPLDIGSMGAAAAGRAVGRAVRRPGFWMAVGIVALAIWLFLSS